MRTQVAIIGAGPSGLLLAQLLRRSGIDTVVLERRSREYVEARIRAGLLEQGTVDLLVEAGAGERLQARRLVHDGIGLAFDARVHRIDLRQLTGASVTVYGQTEIQKDLADAHHAAGGVIRYSVNEIALTDVQTQCPQVTYSHTGAHHVLNCDFIAGCDGAHGVSRASIPSNGVRTYERTYPFGWLGLLADAPPASDELLYASHAHGFALCSMRSKTRSRYYIQCALDDRVADWTDNRFWDEIRTRLPADRAARLVTGPSIEKSIAPLRSFVVEPMQFGRLFLVGDAAHIVPPTGAKGLNLAAADVRVLHEMLRSYYLDHDEAAVDQYSPRALERVWRATRFSWWFTTLMHRFSDDAFARRLQLTELAYLTESPAASAAFAENYVGLPFR